MVGQNTIFRFENERYDMIGSIKNWEKVLYQDVAVGGMDYETAKLKYNYNKYAKWGQKRFDKVYDAFHEIYLSNTGKDSTGLKILQGQNVLYVVMAIAIGLVLAFVFMKR